MDNKCETIEEWVYFGSNCLTRYWIWNEDAGCIAHVEINNILNADGTIKEVMLRKTNSSL